MGDIEERFKVALKSRGLDKRGKGKEIAQRTSYSAQAVSSILTGKNALTHRFVRAFCAAYNLNPDWIWGIDNGNSGLNEMEYPNLDELRAGTDEQADNDIAAEYIKKIGLKYLEMAIEKHNASMVVTIVHQLVDMLHEDMIDIYWQLIKFPLGGELSDEDVAFQAYLQKIKCGLPTDTRLKIERVKYTLPKD